MRARIQALFGGLRVWYGGHSRRDQRIVLGVLGFAAICVVYLWVWTPLRDYRQTIADEIVEGQEQLGRAARTLGSGESLKAERENLEKRLKQAQERLLPGRGGTLGAAALQERTNSLAAEKGITVQSTQVMKEEALDPYRKVSVRLTLSGELKPFAELISALEYGQQLSVPIVEVNRRGAVPGAKGPRTLSATVEVAGFVLNEEAKTEEAKADEVPPAEGGEAAEVVTAEGADAAKPDVPAPTGAAPAGPATGAAPTGLSGAAPAGAAAGATGPAAAPTGPGAAVVPAGPVVLPGAATSTTVAPAGRPVTTTTTMTRAPGMTSTTIRAHTTTTTMRPVPARPFSPKTPPTTSPRRGEEDEG